MKNQSQTNLSRFPVATIGGGSGQFVLLSALRDIEHLDVSAIVSMTDSGGSTGRLRDELGILPPGDILKCILALSPYRDMARKLLLKRFSGNQRLRGHSAGNMLLTMLSQYSGSFATGIEALAQLLDVRGEILPVTTDKSTLVAQLTNGEQIFGENAIDVPRGNQRQKIANVFLVPHHANQVTVFPRVIERIRQVNAVILGPGDLYTSIIPNLLVPGVREALQKTTAKLIYVSNIMTKFGETDGYTLESFISVVEHYIGRSIEVVICNNALPNDKVLDSYKQQRSTPVKIHNYKKLSKQYQLIEADLIEQEASIVRHSATKLAQVLLPFLQPE
ncbi:uridine diphosphate-N-acetylglucosamine-binding protein YvcK [Celerinatantimonas sp. YJH-8]|uniref:gluconeogenesis factor YvcK family protein n=1 Tax=Celerinatantimonas sp. YJH-8 TaxID=3228714 RepID=UPI0038C40874